MNVSNRINIKVGSLIEFGVYQWKALKIQNDKALIISDRIIEKRRYNTNAATGKIVLLSDREIEKHRNDDRYISYKDKVCKDVTWETCELRRYLNEEFYNKFSVEEKAMIAETKIINSNNPWCGTDGGDEINDKIFLLSIDEVVKHFGDSGQIKRPKVFKDGLLGDRYGRAEYFIGHVFNVHVLNLYLKLFNPAAAKGKAYSPALISDRYNSARKAVDASGEAEWWRLRSPGRNSFGAAYVGDNGTIHIIGGTADAIYCGVRPALWLKIK